MKSHKNRALLAGASVIALGLAVGSAAQAAPLAVLTTPFTTPPNFHAGKTVVLAKTAKATFVTGATEVSAAGAASITNGGSFLINATATVPDTFSTAHATAKFDNGLIQTANNAGATATATITNTGTMTIAAQAQGSATLNQAHAKATIASDGINQDVHSALNAQAVLTNSGALTISSTATRHLQRRGFRYGKPGDGRIRGWYPTERSGDGSEGLCRHAPR